MAVQKGRKESPVFEAPKGALKILERTSEMNDSFPASQNQCAVLSISS